MRYQTRHNWYSLLCCSLSSPWFRCSVLFYIRLYFLLFSSDGSSSRICLFFLVFSPPNPSPHLPSIAHPADTEPPDPARPQPSGPELQAAAPALLWPSAVHPAESAALLGPAEWRLPGTPAEPLHPPPEAQPVLDRQPRGIHPDRLQQVRLSGRPEVLENTAITLENS